MTPTSLPVLRNFLNSAWAGKSPVVRRLHEQLLDFAFNPMSKALLIQGPVGAGKTTIARAAGMLKRIAPLKDAEARRFTEAVQLDAWGRFSTLLMPWYVEFAVTGFSETLIDVQLFGAEKGAFTGGLPRPGIFEAAQIGQGCTRGREDPGALLTGGVVFLDEIGDLSPSHQAKLLPVLSGGAFYRIGDEGPRHNELHFNGTTITASWKPLQHLREDLYSRIAANRIEIPGLAARMEDFDLILSDLEETIIRGAKKEIARLHQVGRGELDRAYWDLREKRIVPLSAQARARLRDVDWDSFGNMRALTSVVQKILVGGEVPEEAIEALNRPASLPEMPPGIAALFEALVSRKSAARGLAGRLREIEVEQRAQLRSFLDARPEARHRLARALGIGESRLTQHLQQLDRRRTRPDPVVEEA